MPETDIPSFRATTTLRREDEHVFSGELHPAWMGDPGPHGGHVAASLTRALEELGAEDGRRPASVTYQFLRAPRGPSIRLETRIERRGRSLTSVSLRLVDEEATAAITGSAVLAAARTGPEFVDLPFPDFPPPEDCPRWEGEPWDRVPVFNRYEIRWANGDGPTLGETGAESSGWIRVGDAMEVDASLLTFVSDAFMPPLYGRASSRVICPTVELQVSFGRTVLDGERPVHDWLLARFEARAAWRGFYEETGETWSPDGELLARSRQLAAVRPAPDDTRWVPVDGR